MRVHLPSATLTGDAIDLRGSGLAVGRVARAVREADGFVECPPPGALHERAGVVRRDATLRVRTALALAARSRGFLAPQDEERDRARRRLAELDAARVERVDASDARRRVAAADADVARLRERCATLQGRIQALREADDEAGAEAARADLAEAARALSERETAREAAAQELDALAERQRAVRDARDERRRLADRVANLDRAARRHLVERVTDEYRAAVADAPGATAAASDPFAADGVTATLAVLRVGTVRAPVVLACDRFESATAAAEWLDAPVLRL
ncbi:DUF7856 family protein [Halomarina pelagica]|uniref:DUF7856 family protein n=1 Tax=Halomarina pelagica TaxID=2961599 RepID=UPI0020C3AA8F|nr:hypothetical protein [Halomarina sp. BND7]